MAEPKNIMRYMIEERSIGGMAVMTPFGDGAWVRYSDYVKQLASKDKQIEYYRADRDRLGKIEIEKDKQLASKEKRINELEAEKDLRHQLSEINYYKKQIADLKAKIEKAESRIQELQALRKERDEATLALLKEHEQIADLKAEMKVLKGNLDAACDILKQQEDKDNRRCAKCPMKKEMMKANEIYGKQNSRICELEAALRAGKQRGDSQAKQIADLKVKVALSEKFYHTCKCPVCRKALKGGENYE